MSRDDLHFRLRLPEELKLRIAEQAQMNGRSMTAEMVSRLRSTFSEGSNNRGSKSAGAVPTIDIIWGLQAIGGEIGRTVRQTHYLLSEGLIPGKQLGGRWAVDRAVLSEFFRGGK